MPTPYELFNEANLKLANSFFKPSFDDEAHREKFGKVLHNSIFDLPGPKQLKRPNLDPLQEFKLKLFTGFSEINSSNQSLKNIEIYLSRFPYRGTSITRSVHLRYHFENHLQEVYVLRERLLNYVKLIGRSYRGDVGAEKIHGTFQKLAIAIEKAMQGLVDTRSQHVHKNRYKHEELSRLDTLELLANPYKKTDLEHILHRYYLVEYRKIRRRWLSKIKGTNRFIDEILNQVAEFFLESVYSGEGNSLQPPLNLKQHVSK